MDAAILLVGGDNFLTTLLTLIQHLVACRVNTVSSLSEAVPLIQAQQPDVVIIQANQPGGLELCQLIKEQARLAWIYCLLIDWSVHCSGNVVIDYQREAESRTKALENGADAFLWFPQTLTNGQPLSHELLQQQGQLFRAQLLTGLRMVKTYRELMRTNDILSAIALSDPLTELNNRRALDWELPRQVQNARTRSEHLSLLMLDVDYFKPINDTYGHQVGDRALQLIASRLRHNLRFRDTLFRYGGEEFVIILSGTDTEEALAVAKRLCGLISDQPFAIDANLELSITISAGMASLIPEDDAKGLSLLQRADCNLLQAKATGRNRVVASA